MSRNSSSVYVVMVFVMQSLKVVMLRILDVDGCLSMRMCRVISSLDQL